MAVEGISFTYLLEPFDLSSLASSTLEALDEGVHYLRSVIGGSRMFYK